MRTPASARSGTATVSEMTDDLAAATNDTGTAWLDATAQAELVRSGQVSAAELVDAAIARIEKLNPTLNAVIHPLFERARTAAAGRAPVTSSDRMTPSAKRSTRGSSGAPAACSGAM